MSTDRDAEEIFAEYRRRLESGEHPDFEREYLVPNPNHADALEFLRSVYLEAGGSAAVQGDSDTTTDALGASTFAAKLIGERGLDAESPSDYAPGDQVGPYRLEEQLGGGGFCIVYRAAQLKPVRRTVALKLPRKDRRLPEFLARFQLENQVLAVLDHRNVAKIYDIGTTDDGLSYCALEFVDGSPLTEFCDARKLSIRDRLELFVQVCHGVQHAHARGVLHRDLKPENALARERGDTRDGGHAQYEAKVIDFGLAKVDDELRDEWLERSLSIEGAIVGTPAYMSPEQVSGADVDVRTDVYSLGVFLQELLVGRLPLEDKLRSAKNRAGLARVICEETPARLRSVIRQMGDRIGDVAAQRASDPVRLARAVRGDLESITLRCLEKSPAERYATVSALADDVQRFLDRRPVVARNAGWLYRGAKLLRRRWREAAGLAAGAMAIAMVFVGFWLVDEQELRAGIRATRAAIQTGSLDDARAKWRGLDEAWPDEPRVRILRGELADALHGVAKEAAETYRKLKGSAKTTRNAWRQLFDETPSEVPAWERGRELELWEDVGKQRGEIDARFDAATIALQKALEILPRSVPRAERLVSFLEELRFERLRDIESGDVIVDATHHLRELVRSFGTGKYDAELEGAATVRLTSEPVGAVVYGFRYEQRDGRLVPVPFHPERQIRHESSLRVEKVWDAEKAPATKVRDRWLAVHGKAVHTRGDLARVLREIQAGQEVEVRLRRGTEERTLSWRRSQSNDANSVPDDDVPFIHEAADLGLTFEAYPLDFVDEARIGTTSSTPLELRLQRGSYLFVLRKEGHVDVRYPVDTLTERRVTAGDSPSRIHAVRLPQEGEVPEGFLYIPAGDVTTGADGVAFQPLPDGVEHVDAFAIGRYEVSTTEWLAFVNYPDVLGRIDARGRLTEAYSGPECVGARVIPQWSNRLYFKQSKPGAPWTASYDERWPVPMISHLAAREFAHWKTDQAREANEPWVYRLPTDLEWERAARGVDRRRFVWGNYCVYAYCVSAQGLAHPRHPVGPRPSGWAPFDESLFGVRDLAGSHLEHTKDRPLSGYSLYSYRGGSWNNLDEYFFHVATRNSLDPRDSHKSSGVRLVAVWRRD